MQDNPNSDLRHLHEPSLAAEYKAIEAEFPGWHIWATAENTYAVRSRPGWCGCTVYAADVPGIRTAIAEQIHEWALLEARRAWAAA